MINFITGDLFQTTQPAIGHGVNLQGVMGSGIAPLIKKRYPAVFPPYKTACVNRTLKAGGMLPVEVEPGFYVFNLASQVYTGRNAKLDWVEKSVHASFEYAGKINLSGFALPRIGAGIGGLKWVDVKNLLVDISDQYTIDLDVISLPGAKD